MYARMLGVSDRLAAARRRRRGRPRLPRRRPPGPLSGPMQLPLLARGLRRPLPAPPPQRHLSPPDRRPQRAGRGRGASRPAGLARRRPTSTSTPARRSGSRTTGCRLRPPGDRRPPLRTRRPPRRDQRPRHPRPPPRGLPRHDRRRASGRDGAVTAREHPRARRPQAGGARPAPRLRPPPPQGPGRPLLPARRHPRRPDRLPRRRARATSSTGTYLSKVQRAPDRVALVMERPGLADGHAIQVRKTIALDAGCADPGRPLRPRRASRRRPAPFRRRDQPRGDGRPRRRPLLLRPRRRRGWACSTPGSTSPRADGLTLTDEWLDLAVGLRWSAPAALWCFPIETVSQSESGYEGVYQSSAVFPRWTVIADSSRRWEVRLTLTLDPPTPRRRRPPAGGRGGDRRLKEHSIMATAPKTQATQARFERRFVLRNISWETYEALLRDLER